MKPVVPVETQSVQLDGLQLTLQQTTTACLLQATEQPSSVASFPLALTAPCFFISGEGRVHIESYPKWDIQAVMIIAGGTLPSSTRAAWGKDPDEPCGNQLQTVIIQHGQLHLTDRVDHAVACQADDRDEKAFRAFVYHHGFTAS